jgi:serine/threonine-protein kinase
MKAITQFFVRLAGIGSIAFLSFFLASTSSTSSLLFAQNVTFAGVQTTLPADIAAPWGIAVDSVGDVFITDIPNNRAAVELPWTGTGYGPQTTLPFSGLGFYAGIAVDGAGDVFVVDQPNNRVVELRWTGTGYGPQMTLPFSHLHAPIDVAVDSMGNVFVTNNYGYNAVELPKSPNGYGPQTNLPASGLRYPRGIAVDSAGNVFITDAGASGNRAVVELPRTGTGFGPQITLPFTGLLGPYGVALDGAGNVFIADSGNNRVVELPWTGTGYGPQTILPVSGLAGFPIGIAVDSAGNVFVADYSGFVAELQTRSVNFGGANLCAPGATTPAPCSQTLTLNFNVNADVTLGVPEVHTGGLPGLDFKLAYIGTCVGAVTAGSTCTVYVEFAPLSAGFRNGSVQIRDRGGNKITATQISGFGVVAATGAPVAQLSTTYLPFGAVSFGTSKTLPVMVANIGGGTLTVAPSISNYSGGQSHSYKISPESTCAAGVEPGASCTLVVEYYPTSIATHDGLLTVQSNGGNPTIGLHGGVSGLSVLGGVNGESLKFGTVDVGSTEMLPLTVTNVGLPGTVAIGTGITVARMGTPTTTYKILTDARNTCLAGITAGQSCTLPVEFAPTTYGIHDDLLTLVPSPTGGSTYVWLHGYTP